MTELDLIIDLHKRNLRQGPGSVQDTLQALAFTNLPKNKKVNVADIGCGTGGQTITLANELNADITAIDLFPEFLSMLTQQAKAKNTKSEIKTLACAMNELPFYNNSLDLIWAEGAIYNIGFETGIKTWWPLLKPCGYLAVSEITWTSNNRPKAIEEFWTKEYPEINTAASKITQLEKAGYSLCGYFYLKPESWIDNYYKPLEKGFKSFLERHNYSELAKKVVRDQEAEIALYHEFKAYFSYGFYIAQRCD